MVCNSIQFIAFERANHFDRIYLTRSTTTKQRGRGTFIITIIGQKHLELASNKAIFYVGQDIETVQAQPTNLSHGYCLLLILKNRMVLCRDEGGDESAMMAQRQFHRMTVLNSTKYFIKDSSSAAITCR